MACWYPRMWFVEQVTEDVQALGVVNHVGFFEQIASENCRLPKRPAVMAKMKIEIASKECMLIQDLPGPN